MIEKIIQTKSSDIIPRKNIQSFKNAVECDKRGCFFRHAIAKN